MPASTQQAQELSQQATITGEICSKQKHSAAPLHLD